MCVGQSCGSHVVTNAGPELTAVSPLLMCVGQGCGRRPHVVTELTAVSPVLMCVGQGCGPM